MAKRKSSVPSDSDLLPREDVHKLLLSTPAHFVGEFRSPHLVVTHAWPPMHGGGRNWLRYQGSAIGRTAVTIAFRTAPPEERKPGVVVPNYEPFGETMAAVLSLLYGKRFDTHGPTEMSGRFGIPDLALFGAPLSSTLPCHSQALRADHPVPLMFDETRRVTALIFGDHSDQKRAAAFHSAAKFYRRALIAIEDDPEIAYLHLITAGEILSERTPFVDAKHLDPRVLAALQRIETELPDGTKLARLFRGQLRGIKRRFVDTIASLVDDQFFERRESTIDWGALRKKDFRDRVAAAYDLRSRFLHTGYGFGRWVSFWHENAEIQMGQPVVPDKEMSKILYKAPALIGLERFMRYALLNFAAELGADLSGLEAEVPNPPVER